MLRVLATTYSLHCLTRGSQLPSSNFEGLGSSLKCKHLQRPPLQLKPIHAGSDQNPLYRFHWSPTPHQHPSLTWYAMPILSSDENKQASIMVSPDSSLSLDPPSVLCSIEGQRASSKASVWWHHPCVLMFSLQLLRHHMPKPFLLLSFPISNTMALINGHTECWPLSSDSQTFMHPLRPNSNTTFLIKSSLIHYPKRL